MDPNVSGIQVANGLFYLEFPERVGHMGEWSSPPSSPRVLRPWWDRSLMVSMLEWVARTDDHGFCLDWPESVTNVAPDLLTADDVRAVCRAGIQKALDQWSDPGYVWADCIGSWVSDPDRLAGVDWNADESRSLRDELFAGWFERSYQEADPGLPVWPEA